MPEVQSPPATVTRFYGSLNHGLDVINGRRIAFVRAPMLNDPFDPYFFLETDFNDSRYELIRFIQEHHPSLESRFRRFVSPQEFSNGLNSVRNYFNRSLETTYVLSTASIYDGVPPYENLYLWGHYGGGHRGIAIEYDTRILADSVKRHHRQSNERPAPDVEIWMKIQYQKSMQPITAEMYIDFLRRELHPRLGEVAEKPGEPAGLEGYLQRMLNTKSAVWERESEWRLMWSSDVISSVYHCPIDVTAIKTIYFGMRLDATERKRFEISVREHCAHAEIRQAKKRHGDFAVGFE